MRFIHFDVDDQIRPYLSGETQTFHLNDPENLNCVDNKDSIEIITCKKDSKITPSVLDIFPNLRYLITRTVGLDHIDLEACENRHIQVFNIPDYGSHTIAEHALALALAGAKNIPNANTATHQGDFNYQPFLGMTIKGKTVGVIGTGKIGLEFIKLLQGFGTTILAYDIAPNPQAATSLNFSYAELSVLLSQSDIISIHVPLAAQTKHLLKAEELSLIKDGAILVNTARGAIIDTQALLTHMPRFKSVGLDVLEEEESYSKDNPLLGFDNVIITPHCAFFTDDAIQKIAQETMKIIEGIINPSQDIDYQPLM